MNIKSLVVAALNAAHAYTAAVESLRAELKGKKPEAIKETLLPFVAEYYSVAVVVSESPRNKGEKVLDRSAASFEAAKKALQRLTADIVGAKSSKEEIEIPEELLVAARTLAKRAGAYEGARSLASKALALAFAE